MPMNPKDYDMKKMEVYPVAPCAKCFFVAFGCGTPFSFRLKATSEDTMEFVDNTFCFCVHPSPCPCLPCCGCGPLAQKPRFKRDASDPGKWNGTGESLFAGDCCAGMFHNKGDVITWNDEFDGSTKEKAAKFNSGSSPAYPPCLQNTHFGSAYFKPAGGAAPAGDEMER